MLNEIDTIYITHKHRVIKFGYILTDGIVKSGTVSKKAGRYFVSVLIEVEDRINDKTYSCGGAWI